MPNTDEPGRSGRELLAEFAVALGFLTRLPHSLTASWSTDKPPLAQATRMFPIAGALVGISGGLVLIAGARLGLPALAAAAIAVACTIVLTGALHEDGTADTADGFGGGSDRDRKLEIMRDHQIGTYGAIALIVVLLLRTALIADLLSGSLLSAFLVLVGSEAASRGAMVRVWYDLPAARSDGVAAGAGQPTANAALTAAIVGAGIAFLTLLVPAGLVGTLLVVGLTAATAVVFAELCRNQIGGHTGDTLGATQQVTAVAFLAIAAIVI